MLRRASFLFTVSILFIVFIINPSDTYAYVSSSDLFKLTSDSYGKFTFSSEFDGIYIIHSFHRSVYDPSIIKSLAVIDSSKFSSGKWNGKDISELESKYFFGNDNIAYSLNSSYVNDRDYFIYELAVCIPVKSGDNFSCVLSRNATSINSSSRYVISFIPNGTGIRLVDKRFTSSDFSYTTRTANQHLVSAVNPSFFSSLSSSFFSSPCVSSPLDNAVFSRSCFGLADFYTTPYGLSEGSHISFNLKTSVPSCMFSVYEVFTGDSGGHESETVPVTTSPVVSSSVSSSSEQLEVSSNILTNIKNLLSAVFDLPQKIAESIGSFFTDLKNSIISGLENMKDNLLEGLKYLFVPSDNLFIELKEVIESKFKFVYQILDFGKSIILADFLDVPPNNKITFYGHDIVFMDWTLYDSYKNLIDSIIIIVSYYFYINRLIRRIPGIIGGFH